MLKTIIIIGLGGGVGSILRYLTSVFITKITPVNFPVGTLFVNILGCLIVGLLIGYFERMQLTDSQLRYFFITGFCGGFTTFSAFSAETLAMFESGNFIPALIYITASILVGLLAVWGGLTLTR